jgi:HCOMODA/2-hydroxy-3-carboxy-muconic semialdehyde decarboxylase
MATALAQLAEQIAVGSRILDARGIFDASGHISARHPDDPSAFIIPPRAAPLLADPERMLVLDLDGTRLQGDGTVPLEWPIHARIYALRPDVGSVVHSHSPMSRAFGISTRPLAPVSGIAAPWFFAPVAVLAERGSIQDRDAGNRVAAALGNAPALLLRAHGNVVVGPTVEAAVVRAGVLEDAGATLVQAATLGEIAPLSDEEIDSWRASTPEGYAKAWDHLLLTLNERTTR